jgi:hypothetical protein
MRVRYSRAVTESIDVFHAAAGKTRSSLRANSMRQLSRYLIGVIPVLARKRRTK